MANVIWTWIAAGLTLAIFSFLYKDNPFYKLAEHIYVGSSAAFWFIYLWYFDVKPKLVDAWLQNTGFEKYILIVPAILAVLMLTRFIPTISWLSRWAIAFTVGMGAGLGITGALQGFLVPQLQATLLPIWVNVSDKFTVNLGYSLNNFILVVGTIATIFYFYFSKEHRGGLGYASKVGITFIMIAFGASFGYTVMARISLLIGRLFFLLHDWLHLV
ncbi:MAG: hypothetical protein DRQ06_02945 [Candidatus Hydrothermota bacterium]|uniref:Uncharacterized protein n=1 Tax=candidate division WOR-3 bacterium TaxID=2052148 RepID=A0A7C1BJV2_UNCW3|nr:MAG: hypothetical protein DRQ06_02945 [Candidatus Hydrothermae bacterium]RKZ03347.1 MAG: hypothetical protein DRQ04_02510 [Candidatus Hydrothermae bacterium]HDM90793.1 hypothetical protein [candidate division WOR-3 bacterium]